MAARWSTGRVDAVAAVAAQAVKALLAGRAKLVAGSAKTKLQGVANKVLPDAVKAKDSAVTVQSVRKDPDGSYDVLGTKGGEQVMVEVSADLKTIEVRTDSQISGNVMSRKLVQRLAPSSSAASSSSRGMARIYCVMKNTPKLVVSPGRISPG